MTLGRKICPILLSLLVPAVSAAARSKGDVLLLAWSMSGELALVRVATQTPAESTLAFRVVGPGVMQKHYVVSKEELKDDGSSRQEISTEACRATLVELRDLLRAKMFKGITLRGEACGGDRTASVEVAAEQASIADAAELEPTSAGDALARGDWRVYLSASTLVLESPAATKKLLLPRRIHPGAAHVLLSPSRKLLLVLQSIEGGDQILAAGFASKTGEIADYQ